MCEIHKARLLQDCSSGAPPTPMTGCYDFRRAWRPTPGQRQGPLRVGHVILEALLLDRVSFVSIVAVKVAISSFAATSPVWLALRSSSSFWACVPLTGTARRERKQRGTIIIGNPVHRAIEPTATSTENNTPGYLTKKSHGYFCRLPAICLSQPKPKFFKRFARPSKMVSCFLLHIFVIVNRQKHHNIRNGFVWAQTSHSTSTCTATLCQRRTLDSNLLINSKKKPEIIRISFRLHGNSSSKTLAR